MLPWLLIGIGNTVNLVGAYFNIRSIRAGGTTPNMVSWLIWSAAGFISAAATYIQKGAFPPTIVSTLVLSLIPVAVSYVAFATPGARSDISREDWVCAALSVIALLLLFVPNEENDVIYLTIAADFFASFPTLSDAWKKPGSQFGWNFLAAAFNGLMAVFAAKTYTLADIGFNSYIAVMMGLIGTVAILRKHA